MEKKYQILSLVVGVVLIIVVLLEGVILFKQQRQIAGLIGGNKEIISTEVQKSMAEFRGETLKKSVEESKSGFIDSRNNINGVLKSVSGDVLTLDAEVLNLDEINGVDFSMQNAPAISKVKKTYTVKITKNTKIDKKPEVGDYVSIFSDKSILAVDSFDATEIKIEQTADEIKKEHEIGSEDSKGTVGKEATFGFIK